jgi:hypothetical protein
MYYFDKQPFYVSNGEYAVFVRVDEYCAGSSNNNSGVIANIDFCKAELFRTIK